MIYAPLVMPEVITGLSLLLLFVALGLDRGFWTVTLAHITFTLCFVAIVVQSRLSTFDRSLEEAAQDLGATPLATFMQVTLPLIAPAVAAGWMLAFTLSLDDLVIASFTSGPGATTLPMRIYSQVRLGVTPQINAACTIMIGAGGARHRGCVCSDEGQGRGSRPEPQKRPGGPHSGLGSRRSGAGGSHIGRYDLDVQRTARPRLSAGSGSWRPAPPGDRRRSPRCRREGPPGPARARVPPSTRRLTG